MSNEEEAVFEVSTWVDDRVRNSVGPLIADTPGITWDGWRVALQSACLKDPKLMAAIHNNPNSALLAVVKCAQLGLNPDPALQHFALVPIGGNVEGWPMWRGWQHLAMASGRVVDGTITAEVIYKQEDAKRDGKPLIDPETNRVNHAVEYFERDDWNDSDIIGAYAQAKTVDGAWVSTVMSRKQMQKRLDMGAGTAAKKWLAEMFKAKVLGAMLRSGKVPLTERTRRAIVEGDGGQVETVKAEVLPVEASAPAAIAEDLPTGSKVLFDEMEKDTFPDEEKMAANLVKAITAEFARQKLTKKHQAVMIGCVSADATLDQLTKDELQFVFDKLTEKSK